MLDVHWILIVTCNPSKQLTMSVLSIIFARVEESYNLAEISMLLNGIRDIIVLDGATLEEKREFVALFQRVSVKFPVLEESFSELLRTVVGLVSLLMEPPGSVIGASLIAEMPPTAATKLCWDLLVELKILIGCCCCCDVDGVGSVWLPLPLLWVLLLDVDGSTVTVC